MLFDKRIVAVNAVIDIRHMDDGRTPAADAASAALEGCCVRNMAGERALAVHNVLHPLFIERSAVHHEKRRVGAQLTVAGIAEPLTRRAVGRHTAVHIFQLCAQIRFV